MKRASIQLVLIVFLYSCNSSKPKFEYAQITPDSSELKYRFSDYQNHLDLTKEDLEEAEKLLLTALEEYKNTKETILTKEALQSVKRQYVFYINSEGHRIVWINGLCNILKIPTEVAPGEYEDLPWDWKNVIIQVDDGGPCYWNATINMDTEQGYLSINGV